MTWDSWQVARQGQSMGQSGERLELPQQYSRLQYIGLTVLPQATPATGDIPKQRIHKLTEELGIIPSANVNPCDLLKHIPVFSGYS